MRTNNESLILIPVFFRITIRLYISQHYLLLGYFLKENINTRIIQDILSSMLRSDRNNDLLIDNDELKRLMLRLTMLPGFDFHQDRFLKVLGRMNTKNTNGVYSIGDMMHVFRNLLDDSLPESENVFVLKPKQLLLQK